MFDYDDLATSIGAPRSSQPPMDLSLRGENGIRLHGLDWGGSGPNCLLLHGGAMSAQTWTMCSLLLRDRFRCVSLDLRGHGDSDWSTDYTIPTHVADVRYILEQLGWSKPHLTGMSLGGVVAGHLATALQESPPASLTLIDVAPGVSFGDVGKIRDFMGSDLVENGPNALAQEARRLGATQSMTQLLH